MRTLLPIFVSIFHAELGDKTQLATLLFATDHNVSRTSVFVAASAALVLSTLLAVVGGALVSRFISPAALQVVSALEVDLTGQVWADSIGTAMYSGFGGQLDFMRGAARSRGGKPIIALPATAQRGSTSRIVPLLKPRAGVVTTRGDVHYVVNEFGVAHLYGKTLRQRARALIDIAHPQFHASLEQAAHERKLL